ncbi:MAG: Cdc6/Cdc18 family protein [Candidatus Nanohaloarchaea archaeon]
MPEDADLSYLKKDYIPEELVGREDEEAKLKNLIEYKAEEGLSTSVIVKGGSGTGKTTIAKKVLEEVEISSAYVNAWKNRKRRKIFSKIGGKLFSPVKFQPESKSAEKIFEDLEDSIEETSVVVLDEADKIERNEALYDLEDIDNLILVIITSDPEQIGANDGRLESRFSSLLKLELDDYDRKTLRKILRKRAEKALQKSQWREYNLRLIANSSDGDARKAIKALQQAFISSKAQGKEKISNRTVKELTASSSDVDVETYDIDLNEHQKALKRIIDERGKVEPGELYEEYRQEIAEDPLSNRMLRKHLKEMNRANLIESEGEGRWREYHSMEA